MVGGDMFRGLGTALMIGFFSAILLIIAISYILIGIFNSHSYESKHLITPTIKLHTDGKTIDTIYVYKFTK